MTTISFAQTTVTFTLDASGEDANINTYNPNSNYPNEIDYYTAAWTISGTPVTWRNLFRFDLHTIPPNATILSAELNLYYATINSYGNGLHSSLTRSDQSVIKQVTSYWQENSVTWNNQPSTTDVDSVSLPQSTSGTQDYLNLNVKNIVQKMVSDPSSNFGFLLRLSNEVYYAQMIFASGDNSVLSKHPQLVVTYTTPSSGCITYRIDKINEDATIDNYSAANNYPGGIDLNSSAWTISGSLVIWRNLFKFDLPSALENYNVQSASLSLYYAVQNSYGNAPHSSLTSSNASLIQKVTSPWTESTVTWNNQPSTTAVNQVLLPQSSFGTQDYTNIDVTSMVRLMQLNTSQNYGFMFRLNVENYYARMIFASGDNPDSLRHPTMTVCYSPPTVYYASVVAAGENLTIAPSSPPLGLTNLSATAAPNFKGTLTADPSTGIVKITNARPAGTYQVTLSGSPAFTRTFSLNVSSAKCATANFNTVLPVPNLLTSPYSSAIGDFNGDGNQDIAVGYSSSNNVSVRLGNGAGGFSGTGNIPAGGEPYAIAVADFNNDGKQDFATANFNSATASLRLGDGNGNFTVSTDFNVGNAPFHLATADFNNDHNYDLAVANSNSGSVTILTGNGTGTSFTSSVVTVGSTPYFITTGDFNNDQNADFAVVNYNSNFISVRLGNGSGGFTSAANINTGNNPRCIVSGNFNGDANTDFAVANYSANTITVYAGNGSGGFALASTIVINSPYYLETGDFNGDGITDIAALSYSSNVTILSGNGSGGFSVSNTLTIANGSSIALGDFNNDSLNDLAITDPFSANTVSVHLGSTAEINLSGNNSTIPDGSTTPSLINNTDFGNVYSNSFSTKSFTIQNSGTSALVINSFTKAGSGQNDFSISGLSQPVSINANSSVSFIVTFVPGGFGPRSATIHINNSDCDESNYDFVIQGYGLDPCIFSWDDGNACTVDACTSLTGITHTPLNTDDNNPCTVDGCNPVSGPTHVPVFTNDSIAFTVDGCDPVRGIFHNRVFSMKVFIEGYYTGNGFMDNKGAGGCLYKTGISNNPAYSDSIRLTFVNPLSLAEVESSTGVLNINGIASFNFLYANPDSYYLKVNHRNAMETWSSSPVSLISDNYYDFTDSQNKAYGSNLALTFDNYAWAIYSGDIVNNSNNFLPDGIINQHDYDVLYNAVYNTLLGYTVEDLTGDGLVESADYVLMQNNFFYSVVLIRP